MTRVRKSRKGRKSRKRSRPARDRNHGNANADFGLNELQGKRKVGLLSYS